MLDTEKLFYRNLYRILSDENTNKALQQYATIEMDKSIAKVRTKTDEYFHGYNNGAADAWKHIIELKIKITEIMKNIG